MQKKRFSIILFAAVTACGTHRNKETVRRLYEECINRQRPELLPELVADDYSGAGGGPGPAGFRKTVEGLWAGVPNIHFTLESLVADGSRVAVRWRWTGNHTGTLGGFAASGKPVENIGMAVYELAGGKIARAWVLTDRLGFLQQIGVVPKDL